MGHWEQVGRDNAAERERRGAWPRWRRKIYRYSNTALIAAAWIVSLAMGLWLFGLL